MYQGRLEAFGFLDHGGIFYRDEVPGLHRADFLSSLGLGLNFYYGKYISLTIGYGQPILTAELEAEPARKVEKLLTLSHFLADLEQE